MSPGITWIDLNSMMRLGYITIWQSVWTLGDINSCWVKCLLCNAEGGERPWRLQQMKYGAYWCVVHNSECDHHNLVLAHSIFLLFLSLLRPPLCTTMASISFSPLSSGPYSVALFSFFLTFTQLLLLSIPTTSLCSLVPHSLNTPD